jgi:hypothetical protein
VTELVSGVHPTTGRKYKNIKGLYNLGDGTMRTMVLSLCLVKLKPENPSRNEGEIATTMPVGGLVAHNDTAVVVFPNDQ